MPDKNPLKSPVFGVVMAGGSGERFWPLSRAGMPKQCLSFRGNTTMVQQACNRLCAFLPSSRVWIATRRGIDNIIRSQLRALPSKNIIAEPCGRDTAACLMLTAAMLVRKHPDAIMAVVPADHVIDQSRELAAALQGAACLAAERDVLITFGIVPTEPATGYGYIQKGNISAKIKDRNFYQVRRYHEKPDLQTARRFMSLKDHWWNSGMFVWRAKTLIEEICKYLPIHGHVCLKLLRAKNDSQFRRLVQQLYKTLPKISIDYGVLECSQRVVVTPARFGWDDLGSWASLDRHLPKDTAGNVLSGDTVVIDGRGNLVRSEKGHLVGILGVDNLVVVHTADATLVCSKHRAQEIKKLVGALAKDTKKGRYV